MDSSTDEKSIGDILTRSTLAGVGCAIVVFFFGLMVGTILVVSGILAFLFFNETAGNVTLISLFLLIIILSVIAGIANGKKTFKRLSEKK